MAVIRVLLELKLRYACKLINYIKDNVKNYKCEVISTSFDVDYNNKINILLF
jgi:hypothetical protein